MAVRPDVPLPVRPVVPPPTQGLQRFGTFFLFLERSFLAGSFSKSLLEGGEGGLSQLGLLCIFAVTIAVLLASFRTYLERVLTYISFYHGEI